MERTIYCPKCNRKVGTHDGKSTTNLIRQCKNCRKRVVFDPITLKGEMFPLRKRNTSSGMTFGV